ncbi:MAG TPA: hypothetical protein VL485_27270 [Ktedonobacteraceae bacterium]|nr:hypothetical protein [Ktedonobacteraceae bacterium]
MIVYHPFRSWQWWPGVIGGAKSGGASSQAQFRYHSTVPLLAYESLLRG